MTEQEAPIGFGPSIWTAPPFQHSVTVECVGGAFAQVEERFHQQNLFRISSLPLAKAPPRMRQLFNSQIGGAVHMAD